MHRETRPHPALDLCLLSLALAGFAINLFLLVHHLADASAGIAGCGGDSCEAALASRWSSLFGVPVTVFGALVYCALMLSLTPRAKALAAPLLGMIAGAAAWFIFAQFVLLGNICPWCMTAHGIGIAAVFLGALRFRIFKDPSLWALASFLAIGLAQIYSPAAPSHRIDDLPRPRTVSFDGGRTSYDVAALPHLGPENATHVLVEYFDYQCAACQTMAGYLEALAAKHPQAIAVLLMPVPLDGTCNNHLAGKSQHPGSCEIARLALAVHHVKPGAFPAFHRKLIARPDTANQLAAELIPPGQLAEALADPSVNEHLQSNISDWHGFSKTNDKLPKLLIRGKRIVHGLPASEADFIRVIEKELGLPATPAASEPAR